MSTALKEYATEKTATATKGVLQDGMGISVRLRAVIAVKTITVVEKTDIAGVRQGGMV
jgi:hypothetical protein